MLFSDVQSTQLLSAILPLPHLTVLRCAMCVCWCMYVSVCLFRLVYVCWLVSLCRLGSVGVCVGWCPFVSACVPPSAVVDPIDGPDNPSITLAFVRSSTFCGRHVSS